MTYEQTEGIVLRKVDFSETSSIVTFLTLQRGRMACMVKGARRKGSPMATLLDTYNRLEITYTWRESRQVQLLTEAVLLDGYSAIKADLERIACAAFLLEIAGSAAQENDAAPELFYALREGLKQLDAKQCSPPLAVAQGVYATLEAAGFAPHAAEALFREQTRRMSSEERAAVSYALQELGVASPISNPAAAPVLIRFLKDYAAYQFECALKSYAFLETILRENP